MILSSHYYPVMSKPNRMIGSQVYIKYNDAFIKDTKQWISGIESSSDNAQDQPLESAGCPLDGSRDQNMSKMSMHNQDDINPSDSISNVEIKGSSKRSSASSHSITSSTSSAHIKAETDIAALLVRQNLMKEKHF